ncbi:S8 family serine peptidase [Kineococcus gynurae]|uniref:S8 family serine peptidase n=1 Tax=Kineococcus gynurae TaxID=452979 RepID=A0ABV5LR79_9ACTN
MSPSPARAAGERSSGAALQSGSDAAEHDPVRTFLAGGLAAALVLTATVAAVLGPGQDRPALAAGLGPGDGLDRFVVTVDDGAGAGARPALPAVDPTLLDLAHADLGRGGEFEGHDDATWYVTDASSRRVSLPGAPLAPAPVDDPVRRLLEAVPGVASAQPLTDGTLLVATSTGSAALTAVPGVGAVRPSLQATLDGAADPGDPLFGRYGWNLRNTGRNAYDGRAVVGADVAAPDGWGSGRGAGTVVAVIDTGFASGHEDLQGALWTNPDQPCNSVDSDGNGKAGDCHGWNFYANSPAVDNAGFNAHGVMVSGTIAARADNGRGSAGVAPEATIMPLAVGGGSTLDMNLAAQAIRYAVDNGADVVNCSFGAGGVTDLFRSAVAYAGSKGVLVVASAGNDSADRDARPTYPASLTEPAIVAVGSSTSADTVAAHSAYGSRTVDLFAPGELTVAPERAGGYTVWSGTSDAAPHVAAAVALYRAAHRGWTAAEIKAALLAGTTKVPAFAGRSVSGGRLSLAALGTDAVSWSFSGAGTVPADGQFPVVSLGSGAGAGAYALRGTLVTEQDGDLWAAAGVPVTVDGVTTTTDDRGEFSVDLGRRSSFGTARVGLGFALPVGGFALGTRLQRDGNDLGAARWVPLVVTEPTATPVPTPAPVPSTTPAPSPAPSTPGGSAPTPGAPAPTTPGGGPGPGVSAPGGSRPSTGSPAPVNPVPTNPVPTNPAPANPAPANPAPANPAPANPAPANPAPLNPPAGSPNPSAGAANPATPSTRPTGPASGPATGPAPAPTRTTFGGVGRFRVTSLAPSTVSTTGGQVVVTGSDLDGVRAVRVGDTAPARIVSAAPDRLVVQVPARVPGAYDVTIFAPDLSSSVLPAALTYVAPAAGPGAGPAAPGNPVPGAQNPGAQNPSAQNPGPQNPGAQDPSVPAPGPTARPTTTVGPGGLRLVRRDDLPAALRADGALWRTSGCESACGGLRV